jgi:hypothetical protein
MRASRDAEFLQTSREEFGIEREEVLRAADTAKGETAD